jgi:hypothetical protein
MNGPVCPKCGGGGDIIKRGVTDRGNPCWQFKLCGHRTTFGGRTTVKKERRLTSPKLLVKLKSLRAKKRSIFVITAAQNATPIHEEFYASLQTYCKARHAQLLVIPYRYHNPTSLFGKKAQDSDWWDAKLVPYLMDKEIKLNKYITVLGDIKTQPTASSPTSGFETYTGSKSAVLGHPKLELVCVPTPQKKLPKILTTTGAVTKKNYTPTNVGKRGEYHHTFGAALVEIDGDRFYLRQLNAVRDGTFIDLDKKYTPAGVKNVLNAEALVLGDLHQEFLDPAVSAATFSMQHGDSMLRVLLPKRLVFHDVHDFYARNHHHRDNVFINYAKHKAGMTNVEAGLDATFAFIDKISTLGYCTNVFVASNHPDALARWVRETDPKQDPENIMFWAETMQAMLKGTGMTASGAQTIDPFKYWAFKKLKCYDRSVFLARDESYQVAGIELGYHGDQGANGSFGNIRGFSKVGTKTVIGHSHTPGIREGAYQVGTSSYLKLGYNPGPSSWLNCHCVVYENGKRSLLIIVDGKWKL